MRDSSLTMSGSLQQHVSLVIRSGRCLFLVMFHLTAEGEICSIKSGKLKLYQVKSALIDFKTWCIVISIFAAGIPWVPIPPA